MVVSLHVITIGSALAIQRMLNNLMALSLLETHLQGLMIVALIKFTPRSKMAADLRVHKKSLSKGRSGGIACCVPEHFMNLRRNAA